VWWRNLLFIGLCLTGLAYLGSNLLSRNRIPKPENFDPDRNKAEHFAPVVAMINGEFQADWADPKQHKTPLQTAPRADELVIARRLSLALTGSVPSLEEIRAIESRPEGLRVEWFLSRLLEDRRFADYLAERLARAYVGTEDGPFLVYRRRRFVSWLSDRLYERKAGREESGDKVWPSVERGYPYDEIVRDLISDTGLWTDSPAVNFVTVTIDKTKGEQPDPIRLAARTSRAFLGMRIDCLQCHDDHLDKIHFGTPDDPEPGTQSDFHQLAAFFSAVESTPTGVKDKSKQYTYKYLGEDKEELVSPATPFFADLLDEQGTRRERLAKWVTNKNNKPFARATVNRLWALLFGRPLVQPIDDIPLHGPFPPALETLADDFIEHGYDLRRLIRLIVASDAYQADSRAEFEITEEHEKAWAVFPLTRLRPEQVAGGLIQTASLSTIDDRSHLLYQLTKFNQERDFVQRYGDMGEDEFTDRGGTVTQRLLMMNGELMRDKTEQNILLAVTRIALMAPTDEKAVETVYLTVLSRRPTPGELAHFSAQMAGKKGDLRNDVLGDLFWVLLNSTEFSWNH
jgi:hypothetical protein